MYNLLCFLDIVFPLKQHIPIKENIGAEASPFPAKSTSPGMADVQIMANPRIAVNPPTTEVLYNTILIPTINTNMTGNHPSFLNLRQS